MKLIMCMILETTWYVILITIGIMVWAIYRKWEHKDTDAPLSEKTVTKQDDGSMKDD